MQADGGEAGMHGRKAADAFRGIPCVAADAPQPAAFSSRRLRLKAVMRLGRILEAGEKQGAAGKGKGAVGADGRRRLCQSDDAYLHPLSGLKRDSCPVSSGRLGEAGGIRL